jgi:hypothetical protein
LRFIHHYIWKLAFEEGQGLLAKYGFGSNLSSTPASIGDIGLQLWMVREENWQTRFLRASAGIA